MEADVSSIAMGGGGVGVAVAALWKAWTMFKTDAQTSHLHESANAFASQLMKRLDQADKEINKLLADNTQLVNEKITLSDTVSKLMARLSILDDKFLLVEKKIDALQKENECLCLENRQLKNPPVVGKAGERI